jgi:cell division inhibitor SulA
LPSILNDLSRQEAKGEAASSPILADLENGTMEMVICSFALHLIENASELFALLWQLSMRTRWLVVIAPHKKPDVQVLNLLILRYLTIHGR